MKDFKILNFTKYTDDFVFHVDNYTKVYIELKVCTKFFLYIKSRRLEPSNFKIHRSIENFRLSRHMANDFQERYVKSNHSMNSRWNLWYCWECSIIKIYSNEHKSHTERTADVCFNVIPHLNTGKKEQQTHYCIAKVRLLPLMFFDRCRIGFYK